MEAELANERRQKDFLTAQLGQFESYTTQDKDQIISRLETQLQEHRTLCEKYEHESISKENAIMQMRTKLTTVETELQNVRDESKVRGVVKATINVYPITLVRLAHPNFAVFVFTSQRWQQCQPWAQESI